MSTYGKGRYKDMTTDKHGDTIGTLNSPPQTALAGGVPAAETPPKTAYGAGPKKRKRKWKKWIVLTCILLAVAIVGGMLLRSFGQRAAGRVSQYATALVERRDISVSLTGTGTLQPADSYSVTALIEGEILAADFEEGDIVEKDTVLYTVDSSDTATSLERAQNTLSQSQRSYEKKLRDLENLNVKAPIAGTLIDLKVEEGDKVSAGQTVATVRDHSVMSVTLPFPADDAKNFSVGQSAKVTLDGSYETLTGTVSSIRGVDEILTGNIIVRQVTIEVKNPGGISSAQYATGTVGDAACAGGGTFEYRAEKAVTAAVSGEVSSILAREGDPVSKDQTLLALSSDSLETEIENAANSLRDAELSLDNQIDKLDSYTITSPIQGTIIEKSYKAGDTLSSGKTLCTIYDLSYLTMTLYVDELDISKVKVGQSVTITADAAEGKSFTGTVTKVSIAGTTSGGVTSYPVTIRIDETEGLLPGMNVDAEIIVEQAASVLAIPVEAVSRGNRVLVKTSGTGATTTTSGTGAETEGGPGTGAGGNIPEGYAYVEVTLGVSDESYIEITAGLSEGDEITYVRAASNSDASMMFPGMGMSVRTEAMPSGGMPSGGGNMPSGSGSFDRGGSGGYTGGGMGGGGR